MHNLGLMGNDSRKIVPKECSAISSYVNKLALYPFSPDVIQSRMSEVLYSGNDQINQIINYLLQRKGKMIRPRLVLLCASMGSGDPEMSRDVAVAVELIHMASLVHDDVIDHADSRRGQESLNKRWGTHASVLTGDYLFAAAFNLMNRHGLKEVMEEITRTIQIMCAGEIRQMSLAYHLDITEHDYFQKIYEKTACLFAAACKVGGIAANLSEADVVVLEHYGLSLGYAFQMVDDLLDFLSDSTLLGKPAGSDLLEGNITLPVIYTLQKPEYGPWLRSLLQKKKLSEKQLDRVSRVLIQSGAVEDCLQKVRAYIDSAGSRLNQLSSTPAARELRSVSDSLLQNYYCKLDKRYFQSNQELVK